MSDRADIERWIEDCQEVRNIDGAHGGPDFTKWEQDFLDSVAEQFEERGALSQKQTDILKGMWDRI